MSLCVQLESLEFDINLLLSNCQRYNIDGSAIIHDAYQLVQRLSQSIEPYRGEGEGMADSIGCDILF